MKNIIAFLLLFLSFFSCQAKAEEKSMSEVVNEALAFSEKQSMLMAAKYANLDSVLPRSFESGKMTISNSNWWCSGFFPGVLWYLYENSRNQEVLAYAKQYTARLEKERYNTKTHDIDLMLYCSFGNGLRLTGDASYRKILLIGAKSLATRYNPTMGLIRSWDHNKDKWQYPVIIDNMMNLEFLLWASRELGDPQFKSISVSHADKTMEHHYRPDYSCYHVVSYDSITGRPMIKQTHQGFSDKSSWSRGQAWGLYGFTLMYRETNDLRYLGEAKQIAHYLLSHSCMPKDYIPYWDFDAPNIPNELRDASTAAIIASALIELSSYVKDDLSKKYLIVVEKQLRTLASPKYTATLGENGDFILKHSVGSLPHNSEVDVPLTYADYYYVEALIRYKKLLKY